MSKRKGKEQGVSEKGRDTRVGRDMRWENASGVKIDKFNVHAIGL